ncbi:hypothetical protein CEUSTIGMA_g6116.t1 [Chlamydomonas eustigma]|uniref:Leucine-rich repeat-containing N-terminal plant-type domain-containing protein n=1 Tax=Chlamydomonas eustigma TaxID=1157962 RepID=A0A250X6H5_9CHLO|nr:hypothetical protein CEUSTIGMA_g6116.t1 [Chlamydomonas eustigma]|eukprot:GAX78678.1 hypothetical protein CEUSTIGMA_g6116.t1 [Chlamydomonas eustigma]
MSAVAKAIASARSSGNANLSGRGLTQVPSALFNSDEALGVDAKWWEVADLTKLDLSRNALTALPEELGLLTTLTHLDVSNNSLQCLFNSILNLHSLKLLACDSNQLQLLPETVPYLKSLVVLSVSGNNLRFLPEGIGCSQPQLASIACQSNALEAIPAGLGSCTSLTKLDASNNRITVLSPQLFRTGDLATSLSDLNLSQNALRSLPSEIAMLKKLKVLNLKENQISVLPSSIGGCKGLVELHLGFNTLSSLPDSLSECSELKLIDVRNNKLQELCVGLCSLKLSLLDLTNNDLRTLPPQLGLMTTLRSLPLDGNPLKLIRRELVAGPISNLLKFLVSRLPEEGASATAGGSAAVRSGNIWGENEAELAADMARKISLSAAAAEAAANVVGGQTLQHAGGCYAAVQGKSALREICMRGAGLREIPGEFWQAPQYLQKLDLSCNPLGGIPPEMWLRCHQLLSLNLGTCGLQSWPLPQACQAMPELLELIMPRNSQLWEIPIWGLIACPALKKLDLSGIPAVSCMQVGTLQAVPCLEHLDLSQTALAVFHPDILALPGLKVLKLAGNKISMIPDVIAQACPRLEELDVTNNNISNVTPYISLLSATLRSLLLEGNPLRTMRRTVLDGGTPKILAWLKDRMPIQ